MAEEGGAGWWYPQGTMPDASDLWGERDVQVFEGLSAAPFPGAAHAQALLHCPAGLDPDAPAVVLYFHGFGNCIYNAPRPRTARCPHGDLPEASADLIAQLARSGRSAALIVPELAPHRSAAPPGALAQPGGLARLLDEVLARSQGPQAAWRAADLQRVVLICHSGSYRVAAALLARGDVPGVPIHEVYLLDAVYGEVPALAAFVEAAPSAFAPSVAEGGQRLVVLHGEGTEEGSRALWQRAQAALAGVVPAERLRHSDRESAPDAADLAAAVLVHRVPAGHSAIPATYTADLLASSGLPVIR